MILLGRIFMEIFAQNKEEKRKNQTERKKKKINDDGRKRRDWSVGQRVEAE